MKDRNYEQHRSVQRHVLRAFLLISFVSFSAQNLVAQTVPAPGGGWQSAGAPDERLRSQLEEVVREAARPNNIFVKLRDKLQRTKSGVVAASFRVRMRGDLRGLRQFVHRIARHSDALAVEGFGYHLPKAIDGSSPDQAARLWVDVEAWAADPPFRPADSLGEEFDQRTALSLQALRILDQLERNAPEKTLFTSLVLARDEIQFVGRATSASKTMNRLSAFECLSNVQTRFIIPDQHGEQRFRFLGELGGCTVE